MKTTHKKEKLYDLRNGLITLNKIELKDFKGYNEITVLENINLRVLPGEFVCLLGKDDYAITKLMNVIGGVIPSSGGMVRVEGKSIKITHKEHNIISNKSSLIGWRSVERNLINSLKKRNIPKAFSAQLVDKYIDKFQLQNVKKKLVWGVSTGTRIKVEVSRQLINKQRVLLMNNPFKNLNEGDRQQCEMFIKNLWKTTGKTIIFATDTIEEALLLGSRVIVLSNQPTTVIKEYDIGFEDECVNEDFKEIKIDEGFVELRDEIKMTYF